MARWYHELEKWKGKKADDRWQMTDEKKQITDCR
jgi:hypothetical protein